MCRFNSSTVHYSEYRETSGEAESAPSASSNTTQAAIALELLKRVSAEFHQGEEFDQPSHYANIVTDIDNYIAQLSAVR